MSMQRPRASIFRNEALEHYIQSRENNTLPRITRPPVFLCMWTLLCLFIAAIAGACLYQVPVYARAPGIVRHGTILIFFPTSPAHPLQLRVGTPVHVQSGIVGQTMNSTIDRVEPGVLSPGDVQQRYGITGKGPLMITGPTIVASVKAGTTFSAKSYEESVLTVQAQIDTTRAFSLLLSSVMSTGE